MSKLARFEITLDGEPIALSPQMVEYGDGWAAGDIMDDVVDRAVPNGFGVPGAVRYAFRAVHDSPARAEIHIRGFSTPELYAEFCANEDAERRRLVGEIKSLERQKAKTAAEARDGFVPNRDEALSASELRRMGVSKEKIEAIWG